MMLVLDEVRA